MSDNITKRVGLGTAYGFAKAGGYEGTVEEFTELLGNIAIDLARIENLSVTVTTLPAGSQATASLNGSVLSLGIPKGDNGDKGNTGDTGAPAGFGTVSATVDASIGTPSVEVTASGADTAKNFAFAFHNLKGQKGDKGDTGEVSEAELTQAFEDFSANGTVANAEQLTTDIRANDQTPYLFRTSGGSVDIGDREYINGIVGVSVPWNQLYTDGDFANVGAWRAAKATLAVNNNIGTLTCDTAGGNVELYRMKSGIPVGHKFLFLHSFKSSIAVKKVLLSGFAVVNKDASYAPDTWYDLSILASVTADQITDLNYYATDAFAVGDTVQVRNTSLFDLTQIFGSTIADYIYSLEQATAGAGVAFFKSLFPKPYYAYNAGELKSVKGLVSHDMVGFNAWDEEWESGYFDLTTGQPTANASISRSRNFIPIVPNTTYYYKSNGANHTLLFYDAGKNYISNSAYGSSSQTFTTPNNAYFMKFAFVGTTYNHDICINLSWDGSRDGEYEPYQKWSYPLDSDLELRGIPKIENGNLYYDGDVYESDGTVTRKYGTRAYQSGDESLADAITDGTTTVYKLTTPTTETADPYTSPQTVSDFGTEEYVIDDDVFAIPVGHNTDYPINLKAKVEMMPNSPNGNGDYIVRQTSGENEYISLSSATVIQNIISRLEALEG